MQAGLGYEKRQRGRDEDQERGSRDARQGRKTREREGQGPNWQGDMGMRSWAKGRLELEKFRVGRGVSVKSHGS